MSLGFDCASSLTLATAQAFYSDGFKFVGRYLVPSGWKMLTSNEVKNISDVGLQIVSVFETTTDRTKGGSINGYIDGKSAYQCALAIGQPFGSTIYFAVDFDAQQNDMRAIQMYLNAAESQIQGYKIGVYGSFYVIEAMNSCGAAEHFWQTIAWSHGNKSIHANIFQSDCGNDGNGLSKHGISIDLNESYGNEGSWNNMNVQPLSVSDANKTIAFLSAAYAFVNDDQSHAEFKRVANELRRVSEQPQQ